MKTNTIDLKLWHNMQNGCSWQCDIFGNEAQRSWSYRPWKIQSTTCICDRNHAIPLQLLWWQVCCAHIRVIKQCVYNSHGATGDCMILSEWCSALGISCDSNFYYWTFNTFVEHTCSPSTTVVSPEQFRTGQGHCGACKKKWKLSDSDQYCCGETQTMSHIVESCPQTRLHGGLSKLHSADDDAVAWLTSYGSWCIRQQQQHICRTIISLHAIETHIWHRYFVILIVTLCLLCCFSYICWLAFWHASH